MGTTPQPPRPPVPPSPPRSSSSAVAIALLVLAFIVVVSLFGVWIGFRILARGFHVRVNDQGGDKKEVSIKTPFGDIDVNKNGSVTEASLGLPIYPGAKVNADHKDATVDMRFGSEAVLHIVVGKYHSPDALDKVKNFYQERLTAEVGKFTPANIEIHTDRWDGVEGNFVGKDKEGKTVFEIKRKDYLRIAALKSEFDGTRIELVNVRHGRDETN